MASSTVGFGSHFQRAAVIQKKIPHRFRGGAKSFGMCERRGRPKKTAVS
jgi:hypothetical protein